MSQDTKLAEAVETLLLHFGRGAASEKGVVDDELKALLTEAAEHAAERRASIARKEQVLLDLLTSDISETSEADSMSSSAAGEQLPASRPSTRPGSGEAGWAAKPPRSYRRRAGGNRRHRNCDRLCDNHEGPESTQTGHSGPLSRTSAIRSENGRSIGAMS